MSLEGKRLAVAAAQAEIKAAGAIFEGRRVGIIETSAALGVCLLVLGVAIVFDRRPYHPGKWNFIPIMIVALAAILVLGRHLLSLVAYPR